MDAGGGDVGQGGAADGPAGNEGGSIPEAGGAGMDMMGGSMSGGPPSLNGCQEYLHHARAPQCDDARNVDDWGVRSVAFSPNGQLLAAAAEDDHQLVAEKTLRIRPISLAFSPDGRGLAVGLVACGVLVYCRD